jgi:hypothetical protein
LAFKVAARTVLELGAELISSDAVAIYELVKNAIDARSSDGVTIEFRITLRHSDHVDALTRVGELISRAKTRLSNAVETELTDLKTSIVDRVLPDAPPECRRSVVQAIRSAEVTRSAA